MTAAVHLCSLGARDHIGAKGSDRDTTTHRIWPRSMRVFKKKLSLIGDLGLLGQPEPLLTFT